MGALVVLLIIIVLLVLIAIGIYNSLVVLRNRCDNSWARSMSNCGAAMT